MYKTIHTNNSNKVPQIQYVSTTPCKYIIREHLNGHIVSVCQTRSSGSWKWRGDSCSRSKKYESTTSLSYPMFYTPQRLLILISAELRCLAHPQSLAAPRIKAVISTVGLYHCFYATYTSQALLFLCVYRRGKPCVLAQVGARVCVRTLKHIVLQFLSVVAAQQSPW